MTESVCHYGHAFSGHYCSVCKKAKRAWERIEVVRTKVRGEPDTLIAGDDWREDAACRYPIVGLTPDDWFSLRDTLPGRDSARRAKAVCAECPGKEACLAYALETCQPWGVWGGMTADERGTGYYQQRTAQAG